MKFTLMLVCSLFVFSSCQKKETSETTTVTFTMPDLSGRGSENIYQRVASAPATIDEVNCFAVMVSGPDASLSHTTCPIIDSTAANVSGSKKIGGIRGLVPSGGTISLKVPAGAQRQFTLVGVKANPLSACMDFNDPNLSQDYTSQLFILGESSPIDLQPGVEVNVPIKLPAAGTAFTSGSPRIGECIGPASPSGRGRILPTKAQITKDQFPYNVLQYSTCNAVNISFTDDQGRNGPTIAGQNFILERAEVVGNSVGTFAPFAMFSAPGCTGTLSTEFNVPANTRNMPIFFSSSASPSVSGFRFRLKPGTTAPASTYPEYVSDTFLIAQNGTTSIEVFGTRRVIADMCYNMIGKFKTTDMLVVSGSAYTPTYENIEGKIFPEKFCTNAAIADNTAFAITPDSQFNFSMRFTQDMFASTFISLTPTVLTSSPTVAGKYSVKVVGGSLNPTFLRPEVAPSLPANTAGCFGPYQVLVENEKGGALVTDGAIALSFTTGNADVAIFNNNLCNQLYAANFFDDYRRVFYVGVSTTAVTASTGVSIRAQGQIDHPSAPGNAAYTVSLTTTVNVLFQ